jgi:hydroxymethylpyrimidine pyrophosphatase-like HAD family hydrolase
MKIRKLKKTKWKMTVPKLIIFDLDSTLMSDYGKLYDNVEKLLSEIREKKIKIALASYNVKRVF